jgi:hypothetical protein
MKNKFMYAFSYFLALFGFVLMTTSALNAEAIKTEFGASVCIAAILVGFFCFIFGLGINAQYDYDAD